MYWECDTKPDLYNDREKGNYWGTEHQGKGNESEMGKWKGNEGKKIKMAVFAMNIKPT